VLQCTESIIDLKRALAVLRPAAGSHSTCRQAFERRPELPTPIEVYALDTHSLSVCPRVLESCESPVIQEGWLDSRRVTDVDEQEPRPLRPQQVAISERSDRRRMGTGRTGSTLAPNKNQSRIATATTGHDSRCTSLGTPAGARLIPCRQMSGRRRGLLIRRKKPHSHRFLFGDRVAHRSIEGLARSK
jgi:hypothetical protein